jgi:ABC-type multidrug transport system fused ATPase/permease subunit
MMVDHSFNRSGRPSKDLYLYVWQTSRSRQIPICLLTMLLAPLMTVPLEVQRRIVDYALVQKNVSLLMLLGGAYFGIICLQGGIKYLLNMLKGTAVEMIARDIREKIVGHALKLNEHGGRSGGGLNSGEVVSMLAAEAEDVSGFGGEALGLPLLAGGTILYVAAYLIWVQPAIAILAVIIYLPQAVIVPVTQHTINRLARLRIRTVRSLGHLAVRKPVSRNDGLGKLPGHILINRIYRLRILIYLRKYSLAALGNFLDSLGSIIVLVVGGYLVIHGKTQVGTLVVFISGLGKIADPWDQLINFYRSVSNTAVAYEMIRNKLEAGPPVSEPQIGQSGNR